MRITIPPTAKTTTAAAAKDSRMDSNERTSKGVKFCKTMKVRLYTHLNEFTADEIRDSWWHESEMNEISRKTYNLFAFMELDMERKRQGLRSASSKVYCYRGLEGLAAAAVREKFKRRQALYNALDVVEELEFSGVRIKDVHNANANADEVDQNGDENIYSDLDNQIAMINLRDVIDGYYQDESSSSSNNNSISNDHVVLDKGDDETCCQNDDSDDDVVDDEYYYSNLLAKACHQITFQSQIDANKRALQDAKYVDILYSR